ncbi:hypothetical protein IMZ48_08205 [Candidatus Bathyarchaeota archaeon]|nr:hypothetical protein [Candidatus Bathyarchaeota archaeon]
MVLSRREVETATGHHLAPAFAEHRRRPSPDSRGRGVSRVRVERRETSESSFSSDSYSSSESPVQRRPVYTRPRSVSPSFRETVRAKFRRPSPSPSPPPPPPQPQVIEREIITHYTDVDHGEFLGSWQLIARIDLLV